MKEHPTLEAIPLEQHEVRSYEKWNIVPILFAASLLGSGLGLLIMLVLFFTVHKIYPLPVTPALITSLSSGIVITFILIFVSNRKHNKRVLAYPYKYIMEASISKVDEISRKDENTYMIHFHTTESEFQGNLKVEVSETKKIKLTEYTGKIYLHVEVNWGQIIKVADEEEYPLLICL